MGELTLAEVMVSCIDRGEKAFVPYIMAGDGGLDKLKQKLLFLQSAGVTAIEIGIPFSDPVADGPVIQEAGERALAGGVTLTRVMDELALCKDELTTPLLIMTYLNPILSYGIKNFVEKCSGIGIGGLIIPDLPMEESSLIEEVLINTNVVLIPLVSLTSSRERIRKIAATSKGFVYAVAVNGITGARVGFDESLAEHFAYLKKHSPVPVLAGFGISTPEQVRSIGNIADGVIVGSAIVDAFYRQDLEQIKELIGAYD